MLDVKCSINCSHVTQIDEIDHRNGEIYLSCTVACIQNFFRFSFGIYELHKIYWKHYLKKKYKNIFTSKEHSKIDWKAFPKCIEAGEDERRDIINEIQNYVNGKENKK